MSARDPEPEPAGAAASEDGGDKSTGTKAPLLHQAVARGNVVRVLSFLESKRYSMDELDVVSSSPVIVAAQMGHLAVVELLISLEADVGLKNDDESTALHFACFHGHTAIATFLLTKSAVIQGMNNMGTSGYTTLHCTAREDYVEIVQLMLDHGANPNITSDGWYPLHDACVRDDFEIASLLLSRDANVSAAMHDGTSPLHQTVRFLISRSEVDNRTTADVTSLYAAAELGYLDAIKYLATVNTQWRECNTAVHAAAHNGRVAVLRFLITQGCAMDSPDDKGLTLLCYAVVPGDVDAMDILITAGANVDMKNHQTSNFTPLHYASEFGQNDAL